MMRYRRDHPESYCHNCDGPNVMWVAPSPLWNAVMRGGSINGPEQCEGIVCPTCFASLAEEQGIAAGPWRLTADQVNVELETVTPSGRVWDPQAWLWRDVELCRIALPASAVGSICGLTYGHGGHHGAAMASTPTHPERRALPQRFTGPCAYCGKEDCDERFDHERADAAREETWMRRART